MSWQMPTPPRVAHRYNESQEIDFFQAKSFIKQSQRRIQDVLQLNSSSSKQNLPLDALYDPLSRTAKLPSSTNLSKIHQSHREEVQKLLMEIKKLHCVIQEQKECFMEQKYRIQKQLKGYYEDVIENFKRSGSQQIQILNIQVKKWKQQALNYQSQCSVISQKLLRQNSTHNFEMQNLHRILKQTVEKKNAQIFQMEKEWGQRVEQREGYWGDRQKQSQEKHQKQLKKYERELQQTKDNLKEIQKEYERVFQKAQMLEGKLEEQRVGMERKLFENFQETRKKYMSLSRNIDDIFQENENNKCESDKLMKQMYEKEIDNLLKVIQIKQAENQTLKQTSQESNKNAKILTNHYENQNKEIKKKTQSLMKSNLQQIEHLKVKLALLHQNDITQLVKLYETKIQNLGKQIENQNSQTQRLRKYIKEENQRWYHMKKTYEAKISKQNVQILSLKHNLGSLQKDLKDQFESQKSAMLLTSHHLIKTTSQKQQMVKFSEQELRKLRITLHKCQQSSDLMQETLRQQISQLQSQLESQSKNFRSQAQHYEDLQNSYIKKLQQKSKQIQELQNRVSQLQTILQKNNINSNTNIKANQNPNAQKTINSAQQILQQLQQMKIRGREQSQMIKQLQNIIDTIQRELQVVRAQNQQLHLEMHMTIELDRSELKKISEQSNKQILSFYEKKISQLETDKEQLVKRLQFQEKNMGELVRKYKLLQGHIQMYVTQAKKRTLLEEKIVNLGLDQCLVKNKAELFKKENTVSKVSEQQGE